MARFREFGMQVNKATPLRNIRRGGRLGAILCALIVVACCGTASGTAQASTPDTSRCHDCDTAVGFVEVEELVFGERAGVLLDPAEERIKSEFEGVKRSFLPLHSVLRIDEVSKRGASKISQYEGSNVTPFPSTLFPAAPSDPGRVP